MKLVLRLVPLPILALAAFTMPRRVNYHGCYGSREMAAVKAIAAIHTAETQYYSQFGRYAPSLSQLGLAGLIERDLASGQRGGFKLTVRPTPTGYAVTVAPLQF